MNEGDPAILVEGLGFRYGGNGFSLDIPRLRVAPGERVAFIGPSGSGKTTLLHLLAGILVPSRGRIRVLGREISGAGDAERRAFRIANLGLIFQEFELIEHLTVRENVLLPYYLNRTLELTREVRDSAERLASSLGIGDLLSRRPRKLSQGERQRVAIGRALVTGPAVVLADEPTGNLDPENTQVILDLVEEQVSRRGATFLMVTHDHSLLGSFDRVVDLLDPGS